MRSVPRHGKAFPFRGVERPENSSVNCFQRDGDGSPVERWPSEARSKEVVSPLTSPV